MRRRTLLAVVASAGATLPGCLATTGRQGRATRTPTPTSTPAPTGKPGTVDNHRVTAVGAVSHDAFRRSTDDGHEWVVTVTLRLKPQDPEAATPFPIGVFFVFFDADGRKIHREYEQVPANTTATARTVTLSQPFRPAEAGSDTFDRYRIDLVHA